MKQVKLINLFILALFCQVVFSQNNDIVRSFNLRKDKSVEKGLDSTNVAKALKSQFKIPENYEFKRQLIKGSKNRMSEKDNLGYVHERYAQYYKGIKIEHSDIRVRYLNGSFVSANGKYIDVPTIDISIVLSKEKAIEKAKEYIGAKEYMWENEAATNWLRSVTNDETASYYPNTEIVICKNSMNIRDAMFYVAYKINIYAKMPFSHDYVYVNAKNGEILAVSSIIKYATGTAETRYSGTRSIETEPFMYGFRLKDVSKNIKTQEYLYPNIPGHFIDIDNDWTAAEYDNIKKDNGALDAHWGAATTFDYFNDIHGRNSYDNNGGWLDNYIHVDLTSLGIGYTNNDGAFWDGDIIHKYFHSVFYGDGTSLDIFTSLDIVAHEIGHGVCEYMANLVYEKESGAINESLSDIWGACVQNYADPTKNIWLIGDEIGGPIRSMSNPNNHGQPHTYGQPGYWYDVSSCAPIKSNDFCGIHTNSGVMNYWFYLLSVGGSGTNGIGNPYSVTGIGISKAEKIVYGALFLMTSGTDFADARTCTIDAAIDLYGDCTPEVISVANAWYAVGVGNLSACMASVKGTVFPFVKTSDPAFDALFPVTANLYAVPKKTTIDPFSAIYKSTAIYTTTAQYYNGSVYIPGTPKYPGTVGAYDNPGYPIDWSIINKTPPTPNSTPVSGPGDVPNKPVGLYSFPSVTPGNYVLVLSRPGLLSRYIMITVPPGGDFILEHRELLAGEIFGGLEITGQCVTEIYRRVYPAVFNPSAPPTPLYPDPSYNSKNFRYDINADNAFTQDDDVIARGFQGFNNEGYTDTKEWLLYYQ